MADWQTWMKQANFVAGAWIGADSGQTIDVTNPATGEVIGTVPACGEAETMRAIDAAAAAFSELAGMDLMTRVGLLWKLHDALMDNQAALAELLTVEMGKPLAEAKGEIAIGAQYVRWFAEEARRAKGEIVPPGVNGRRILVTRHPVGVRWHDHAVELPVLDAGPQGCTRACRGLHDRGQAGDRHALFGSRMGGPGRGGRIPRGRGERADGLRPRHRGCDDGPRRGAQDHLHRAPPRSERN